MSYNIFSDVYIDKNLTTLLNINKDNIHAHVHVHVHVIGIDDKQRENLMNSALKTNNIKIINSMVLITTDIQFGEIGEAINSIISYFIEITNI